MSNPPEFDLAAPHLETARRLANEQRYEEALPHYEAALNANPTLDTFQEWFGTLSDSSERVQAQSIERIAPWFESDARFQVMRPWWANCLSNLGRYFDALEQFHRAVQEAPNDVSYDSWLETLDHIPEGDRRQSMFRVTQMLESRQDAARAWWGWGHALLDRKSYAEAEEKLDRAAHPDPGLGGVFYDLGCSLAAQGRQKEATQKFERAIQLNPVERTYEDWVASLEQLEPSERDSSSERVAQILGDAPEHAPAWALWGQALLDRKLFREAAAKFEKATQLDAKDAESFDNLGICLAAQEAFYEAVEKFEEALKRAPSQEIYTRWVAALEELDDVDRRAAVDRVTQITADQQWANWGAALLSVRRYKEAAQEYEKAVQKTGNVWALINLGVALAAQRNFEAAKEKFRKVVQMDPSNRDATAQGFYQWGLALVAQKKYDDAFEKYAAAVRLGSDKTVLWVLLDWGNALAARFRYREAQDKFKKALELDGQFVYAQHNIAYFLMRQGRYRESRSEWEHTRRLYEDYKETGLQLAGATFLHHRASVVGDIFGDLEEAEPLCREGLALDPNHTDLLADLASLYLEMCSEKDGDRAQGHCVAREYYQKAERLLQRYIDREGDLPAMLQLADLLIKTEELCQAGGARLDKAEKLLIRVLEKDPDSKEANTALGVIFSKREDYRRAAQYFQAALCLDPDDLNAWSNLAETYLRLKQKDRAAAEYEKILKIAPEHLDSLIGLGQTMTELGEDGDADLFDRAVEQYSRAIQLAVSGQGSKRLKKSDLASVYYSRGYARVKAYEAQKLGVDETSLREALDDFRRCVVLDPDHHRARRALEKLERRLQRFTGTWLAQKAGPWFILVPSLFIFVWAQKSFYFQKNGPLDILNYIALSFGALVFTVVGLYLPQILKLKVAGVEIEKSAVEQISTTTSLGLKQDDRRTKDLR